MNFEDLLEDIEMEFNHAPIHAGVDTMDMHIAGGAMCVRMYRGTNTHDVDGVTWWTTDKAVAMGTYYQGVLLERVFTLPIEGHMLVNPSGYLLGNKHTAMPSDYAYGISDCVDVRSPKHFYMSICVDALNSMSI